MKKKFRLSEYIYSLGDIQVLKETDKFGDYYVTLDNEKILNILNMLYEENIELKHQDHTIDELYEFRLMYNALLFNLWEETGKYEVYKSKRHDNGELCFDGDYFIVVAMLPKGQISNHYPMDKWEYFKIPEYEKVKDEFDGHTSQDVLDRLRDVI